MQVGRPATGTGEPFDSPHSSTQQKRNHVSDIKKAANKEVAACPPVIRASKPGHVSFRDMARIPEEADNAQDIFKSYHNMLTYN